jgi:peptidoglycan/xylan/chitin deacetylase (PgdA/CDA1 family)
MKKQVRRANSFTWIGQIVLSTLLLLVCQYGNAVVVLQYHHVSEDTPAATSISPQRFTQHMTWLAENGYKVISMEDLLVSLKKEEGLPDKTVVITFDDGYTSIYSAAWPVLKQHGWPFTVFVNSQHHDTKNAHYMSWAQLREMAEAGVAIGNHSVSHGHMIRFQRGEKQADWQKRMRQEIEDAQKRIDEEVGRQPKVFAYPFGEHNRDLEKLLAELDYVAFAQHSGPIAPFDSVQALPRFPFGGVYGDLKDFALKASSLPMPLQDVVLTGENMQPLVDPLLPDGTDKATMIMSAENALLKRMSCFYSGKAAVVKIRDGRLYVSNNGAIPAGRSRFNCTAPKKDRFYWLSKMLIRKNADGSWYEE